MDDYNDDLIHEHDPGDPDVMQVYRAESGVCSFMDYEDFDPIYERDAEWIKPTEEEMKAREDARKLEEEKRREEARAVAITNRKNMLNIVAQAFYGNRTCTVVAEEDIDGLILGYSGGTVPDDKPIDRTIIKVPGTDNLVFVYNKYQEAYRLEVKEEAYKRDRYQIEPLVVIPEMGVELYSRCIACRSSEDGSLESLQKEDYEKFMKYLAD